MGFNLKKIGQGILTGGASTVADKFGDAAGVAFNPITGGANLGIKSIYGSKKEDAPAGMSQAEMDARAAAGEQAARKNASIYYGSQEDLGADAADYRSRVKGNLGQSSALANRMTQSANQDISRANVKAGLKGVDTSAATIRERRNSIGKSAEIQQGFDQQNLSNYGKSIGAGIAGTESLAAAGAGASVASTPGQTPSYGGFLGSIICTELYNQRKITLKELSSSKLFRDSLAEEIYFGYLVIARPIVWIMKRSDKFSNLFIGWAKSISRGEINKFTAIMIPICSVIGSMKVKGSKYVTRA